MKTIRLLALVATMTLVVAACGGETADSTTTADTTTTTSETTTSQEPTTTEATSTTQPTTTTTAAMGTEAVQSPGFPGTGTTALLTDVTVTPGDGTTQIVFTFEGGVVPEYEAEYIEPPITEGASGQEVEIEGEAFLSLTMAPASGVDLAGDTPRETYTGADEIMPGNGGPVVELEEVEDFESVMSWVVGLDSRLGFGVDTALDPSRVIVTIAS